jgi:peptidoglycan LD-endopeptidase CwlK
MEISGGERGSWSWLRMQYLPPPVKSEGLMDIVSEDRLKLVHPLLAAKVRAMAQILSTESIMIRVTQGLRTWDEQAKLYDQGRTTPGEIVTNAQPGQSYHQFGLAVDVVPMTPLGPDWDPTNPVWRRIIEVGKGVGLTSGSMWRTFPDMPHFQLTGVLPASPTPAIRKAYLQKGIPGVWDLTGYTVA